MSTSGAVEPGTVVVGVDGSEPALRAVDTAAVQAHLLGCPLEVVHAFMWPELRGPAIPTPAGFPRAGLRTSAERIVDEAVRRAQEAAPGIAVSGAVITGAPEPVLLRASVAAALVVVGDRGLGGFAGLLLGSVAVELASYAQCPVVVVRGRSGPSGPVVVGVDGSAFGDAVADLALSWAAASRLTLRAVHAVPDDPSRPAALAGQRERWWSADAAAVSAVFSLVEDRRRRYPMVAVEREVRRGDARRVLIRESKDASLVVVGSRGRGGFEGLVLGSVSHATLHHAACPVAVVPHLTRGLRPPLGPHDVRRAARVEGELRPASTQST